MAYINQEQKKVIAENLKTIVPEGWKYSLSIENHSVLVMTIASAPVDLMEEWFRCNSKKHGIFETSIEKPKDIQISNLNQDKNFDESLPVINSIMGVLNTGNHDQSDLMTDYFDVGFYVKLNIGTWNKPFKILQSPSPTPTINLERVKVENPNRPG